MTHKHQLGFIFIGTWKSSNFDRRKSYVKKRGRLDVNKLKFNSSFILRGGSSKILWESLKVAELIFN
jgi:hypothetical protein